MQRKIDSYISTWRRRGYEKDIPDSVPDELMKNTLAPSYKAIALAILQNDHSLRSLGYTPDKTRWYSKLKRIELEQRGLIKKDNQTIFWPELEFINE